MPTMSRDLSYAQQQRLKALPEGGHKLQALYNVQFTEFDAEWNRLRGEETLIWLDVPVVAADTPDLDPVGFLGNFYVPVLPLTQFTEAEQQAFQ